MLIDGRNSDSLPVLDRGLLYGDGLFETVAFIGDDAPLWGRHMDRLALGCERLEIDCPDSQLVLDEARSLTERGDRQVVKIIVTRGQGGHGYFPGTGPSTRILYRRPWVHRDRQEMEQGLVVHLSRIRLARGSATAGLKTLNRLEQVLAAKEAEAAGYQEAILCDSEGNLVEGLMSNLFWMTAGELYTPGLEQCGVAGVMRGFVLETAGRAGIRTHIVETGIDALAKADALFLTNATGLRRVSECNGNQYDIHAVPQKISAAINELLKPE